MSKNNSNWSMNSWRAFPIKQQPIYKNITDLLAVEKTLQSLPPLATPSEIRCLNAHLTKVANGEAFLLQGGDCAESFTEFSEINLRNFFQTILQMTMALMYGAGKPVVKVGRIAGQFAKPRSSDMEEKDGISLPSYRGDIINSADFTADARIPNPNNMLNAYYKSTATLNFLRALFQGGDGALKKISDWNMNFLSASTQKQRFSKLINDIDKSLNFIEACGLNIKQVQQLSEADFFTSHEALLLGYEESLTREDNGKFYDCSAHMLWIGDRTRNPDEAHIEFLRGVENPIGCKVGPSMTKDDLLRICSIINPDNIAGRLTLIARMGAEKVGDLLPQHIRTIKEEGLNVIWSCDPMHGNIIKSPNGYKTRKFNDILSEVKQFFAIHKTEGTYAGGVHFEMTGQNVTECLGGAQAISETDLSSRYNTSCDPRLNASQSIELAFLIAEELRQ